MTKEQAFQTLAAALLNALATSGAMSGHTVATWQPVVAAAITVVAAVGIHSIRKPKP